MASRKYLVLGLGNPIKKDDSVGLQVVRKFAKQMGTLSRYVDLTENHSGGIDLLDQMSGYTHVLMVDSIQTGIKPPGTYCWYDGNAFSYLKSDTLLNAHSFNVPTLLAMGRKLGYPMPHKVEFLTIEASDLQSFSESLTPEVNKAIDKVMEPIREKLEQWIGENNSPIK